MTPGVVDSLGFEALGDIGPAPPEAPLSYYVEYGPDPSEPELRLFIACSASLPKLPKPSKPRKPRKPTLRTLVTQAEKATGKAVTSITTPDGTTLHFGEPEPTEATNPWLADLDKVKQQ